MALDYRFLAGWTVQLDTKSSAAITLTGRFLVEYDDGQVDGAVFTATTNGTSVQESFLPGTFKAKKAGRVVGALVGFVNPSPLRGQVYAVLTLSDGNFGHVTLCRGYVYSFVSLTLGTFVEPDFVTTWVIQGTVAEDATAGTHVCSLTVTPGAGNEFEVLYGLITGGATATAQLYSVFIDDGTNVLTFIANNFSSTSISATFGIGDNTLASSGNLTDETGLPAIPIVSGTMRLILRV